LNGLSFAWVTLMADCASDRKNASMQAVMWAAVRNGEVGCSRTKYSGSAASCSSA
jgi:hypothetical protein